MNNPLSTENDITARLNALVNLYEREGIAPGVQDLARESIAEIERLRNLRGPGPTITDLWNDRILLSARIEELVKPFIQKYGIRAEDVEIGVHYSGISIKVKL